MTLLAVEVAGPDDVDRALTAMAQERPEALVVHPSAAVTPDGQTTGLRVRSPAPAAGHIHPRAMGGGGRADVLRNPFPRLVAARRDVCG